MSLIVRTIVKKRDGGELSEGEIRDFVAGVTNRTVTDEQAAALLMAICCRGMTTAETAALTFAMMNSGETWDLSPHGFVADKHSTGGVGDKSTLVLAPLLAACGVKTGMMSGCGLGHTGGTLDKLEAIPGFVTGQSKEAFDRLVETVGCALIAATDTVAPADRRLYALRDVTGTVESIPLITASILSKKLAEGLDGLVLDVKVGRGAFMKTEKDAVALAESLVAVGTSAGTRVSALLTRMDVPLGRTIGNAIETREAIELLHGRSPDDLLECTLALGVEMLKLAGLEKNEGRARASLSAAIADGSARRLLAKVVGAQGGDPRVVEEPDRLPSAPAKVLVPAPSSGVVVDIDAMELALSSMALGAGRVRTTDPVDPSVGLVIRAQVGERVEAGAPLAELHCRSRAEGRAVAARVAAAFRLGRKAKDAAPLVLRRIDGKSVGRG